MTDQIDTGRCFVCGSDEPPAMHAVMGHLPPEKRPKIIVRRVKRAAWLDRAGKDLTGQIGDR